MSNTKFRLWSEPMNCWVDKFLINQDGAIECFAKYLPRSIEPDKKLILEQFTGFKDKNGKEVYVGDICLGYGYDNIVNSDDYTFLSMYYDTPEKDYEVIGNIHDGVTQNVDTQEEISLSCPLRRIVFSQNKD